jgi:hypothetical protein
MVQDAGENYLHNHSLEVQEEREPMKRIETMMALLIASLILVTPCVAADQGKSAAAERTGGQDESASTEGLFITMKVPLSSPLFSGYPVALVNTDKITVEDLMAMLASSHKGRVEGHGGKGKMDFSESLRKLINLKLLIQEARNTGIDELFEVKSDLETFKNTTLIQLLMGDLTKEVVVDDKEVDPLYKEMVREWKIKSVLFHEEETAKKAVEALKKGDSFDEIVSKALKDGTARGSEEGQYLRTSVLAPEVIAEVLKMKVGSVSPLLTVGSGKTARFTLVRLEDVRYPENTSAREEARQLLLSQKRDRIIKKHQDALYKKYVKLDEKLLQAINYDSPKPGMAKLVEDNRVLAKIAGEKPVTVKELSVIIRDKFFHGVEKAMQEKRVNKLKKSALDSIIGKRVFRKEALLRGLDKTPQYQRQVKEREDSVLFGMFVQKVVARNVKLGDEDIKTYYNDHLADYEYPSMVRLNGLAFDKLPDAESALEKLKKGADYAWIKENAAGQTDKDADNLLVFDGVLILTKLPQDVQKSLSGAKAGDHRLAAGPDGRFYVLSVQDVIPARTQTIEEATATIVKTVFKSKLDKSLKEWEEQLRQTADIEIYLQH